MLHISMGGNVTLSGANFCGEEFVVVANWWDTHQYCNTSADENNPGIFPINKSDGITATYQEKTKKTCNHKKCIQRSRQETERFVSSCKQNKALWTKIMVLQMEGCTNGKSLARKLPSFIQDTTDLLKKIENLNTSGPFPTGTLLVSWDVVSMFPNIDNKLGLTAVRKALNTRENKFPSRLVF